MKLEDQVVSLDLAERLKELGVKQESLWYWNWALEGNDLDKKPQLIPVMDETDRSWHEGINQDLGMTSVSAFTVAELGEMLPKWNGRLPSGHYCNYTYTAVQGWTVEYHSHEQGGYHEVYANTEAESRGRMLVYLLKNKLITLA
jgi:hypothetical protein